MRKVGIILMLALASGACNAEATRDNIVTPQTEIGSSQTIMDEDECNLELEKYVHRMEDLADDTEALAAQDSLSQSEMNTTKARIRTIVADGRALVRQCGYIDVEAAAAFSAQLDDLELAANKM